MTDNGVLMVRYGRYVNFFCVVLYLAALWKCRKFTQ